ncbi:MAG: hypothetical protein GY780_14640 [bacterium]|nr:hypothetical protein [bacterium]
MVFRSLFLLLLAVLTGCAGSVDYAGNSTSRNSSAVASSGSTPVALEFVQAYENEAAAVYFPLEGLAGCEYTSDGSLIICDEKRGKVFGLDSGNGRWYEFDRPMVRPYRPVDAAVDGFKILILENGSDSIQRFDLSGAHQDQLLNMRRIDPSVMTRVGAFAVDRDGSMVVTDVSEQQVLQLDSFLNLKSRLGEPGVQDDQFTNPNGIDFLPDGRIIVADTGNSRLCIYSRTGFFESIVGGTYDANNPFLAPGGIDSDRHGNVFVADLGSGSITTLDRNFRFLFASGSDLPVRGIPEMPVDLAVGPSGQLAVMDRSRQAILIYRIIYE